MTNYVVKCHEDSISSFMLTEETQTDRETDRRRWKQPPWGG